MIVFRDFDPRLPRSGFDCGKAAMNDWFRTQAGQQERGDSVRTHLGLATVDSSIASFYSLAAHRIELDTAASTSLFSKRRYPIPSLLIARLAVDVRYQGNGIGALTLGDALSRCATVSKEIGVEVILVDAIDESAAAFYKKHGFEELTNDGRTLFVSSKALRASLPKIAK